MATWEAAGQTLHFEAHFQIGLEPGSHPDKDGMAGDNPPSSRTKRRNFLPQKQDIISEKEEASHGMM